ncbi:hypothetical protein KUCAC02_011905 [Chaenocephalus aceratus]|uniref:Uncharacterized protein n=1 Tax=Chaenocephalus aceratus TaxID=36190 RepID=A0ACB9XAL6_CHAAC|nr:hypothetical protein KUCAC02_011905 [Chaenocephalus aceratus]
MRKIRTLIITSCRPSTSFLSESGRTTKTARAPTTPGGELPQHAIGQHRADPASQEEEDDRGRRLMSLPPLLPLSRLPPLNSPLTPRRHRRERDRERRHSNLSGSFSPSTYRKIETANGNVANGSSSTPSTPSKFRSLTREAGSSSRRGVADGGQGSRAGGTTGGGSAESSPYFTRRTPEPAQTSGALPELHDAPLRGPGLALPLGMTHSSPTASPQRMEWKVKVRSDGHSIRSQAPGQRSPAEGQSHEDQRGAQRHDHRRRRGQADYWSKEERKQQMLRAREYRRRREFMMQSRLEYLKGDRDASSTELRSSPLHARQDSPGNNILLLSQKKITKKRNRRILDNWITIQELLAHGSRSPDGKKIYNPLLSVTTV